MQYLPAWVNLSERSTVKSVPLFEAYRPRDLDSVVGQERACAVARSLMARGMGGRAVWIVGDSGTGKTTIGKILCASIADDWMTTEYDSGADLTPGELNRLLDGLCLCGSGKGGRAVLVNEAHSMRADVIDKLKGVLERIPDHVCWVFTTTKIDQAQLFGDHVGAAQLLSRCVRIATTNQGFAQAGAERLMMGAKAEGLDGVPLDAYVKLMRKCGNNLRAAWMEVESGAMLP